MDVFRMHNYMEILCRWTCRMRERLWFPVFSVVYCVYLSCMFITCVPVDSPCTGRPTARVCSSYILYMCAFVMYIYMYVHHALQHCRSTASWYTFLEKCCFCGIFIINRKQRLSFFPMYQGTPASNSTEDWPGKATLWLMQIPNTGCLNDTVEI